MDHATKSLRDYRGGANQGGLVRAILTDHNNALIGLTATASVAPQACACRAQLAQALASIAELRVHIADLASAFSAPAVSSEDDASTNV
jgi:hypothetical protein